MGIDDDRGHLLATILCLLLVGGTFGVYLMLYFSQQQENTINNVMFSSPLSTPTNAAFLPLVAHSEPTPWTSSKKGIRRHLLPPDQVDFGATWEYIGLGEAGSESLEQIIYLASVSAVNSALTKAEPAPPLVMFYNEYDWGYFAGTLTLPEMVAPVVALVEHWPGVEFVGPCNAFGPEFTEGFLAEYERQAGEPLSLHAWCMHCYDSASACVDKAEEYLDAAGGKPVWVTEFNLPPGLDNTIRQVTMHNQCLVTWMENEPLVERYSPWAGEFRYGDGVPADRVTGWQPLAYAYRRGGVDDWDYTEIGKAYAFNLPTWEKCLEGAYLRIDQVPPEHRPTDTPTPTPTLTSTPTTGPQPMTRIPPAGTPVITTQDDGSETVGMIVAAVLITIAVIMFVLFTYGPRNYETRKRK